MSTALPVHASFNHIPTRTTRIQEWWAEWGGYRESSCAASSFSPSSSSLTSVADLCIIICTCTLHMVSGFMIGWMPSQEILAGILVPFLLCAVVGMFTIWRRMDAGRYRE